MGDQRYTPDLPLGDTGRWLTIGGRVSPTEVKKQSVHFFVCKRNRGQPLGLTFTILTLPSIQRYRGS